MTIYIGGFICALVLAAFVVLWIAYCMFVRERHKSEVFHSTITDLKHKNFVLSMEDETERPKKEMAVGVFVLPSRRHKDDVYDKRPDYPERAAPASYPSTDKLIEILENVDADVHCKDGIYVVDSAQGDSDV